MPKNSDINSVLIIGAGPIVIGQACEFDYSGAQACKALKEEGLRVVLVNSNPATIMTDEGIADRVYVEPLNTEVLEKIIDRERPDGILPTLGGQTGLNLAVELHEKGILEKYQVELLGTSLDTIKKSEDRDLFSSFLKEIGEIPTLFAFPYGETNSEIIELIKDYKFKVAFGQHSGVINETSNMYYLPRFSLNERYGEIDRVKFAATAKGLGVYDFIPSNPTISENPPYIGFSLLDDKIVSSLDCFIFDSKGQVEIDIFKFNERVEIRLERELSSGRSRMNCTAKDKEGNWRWYGHQFYF